MTEPNPTPNQNVRAQVAESYTRAVERRVEPDVEPGRGGCCRVEQKGIAAKLAGYQATELGELPADAVANSFGCGNPIALADLAEGDVVLDLGSGAGIDLLLAAARVGDAGRVIGVDMTDAMIERARANVAAAGRTNVEVRQGIIEDLPVDDASVDRVISNCVINLSPEKPRVFAEIVRVLRPGGSVSISDIVADDLPEVVRGDGRLHSGCIAGAISEAEYVRGLEEAGLSDVRVVDRVVYDADHLANLIASDIVEGTAESGEAGCGCGCGAIDPKDAPDLARRMAGKVWSMRVVGRRREEA